MQILSVQSKNMFFLVKIIVHSLKLFGLAPFRVSLKSSAQITTYNFRVKAFRVSKIGLAYNILLLITVIVGIVLDSPYVFESDSLTESSSSDAVVEIILQLQTILTAFTACIILIHWGLRQRKAASIVNRLLEIDLGLSTFEQQPFNKRALIFLTIHILLNTCLWIPFWSLEIMYYYDFYWLVRSIMARSPKFIIYWFIFEYSAVVSLLANNLEAINQRLMNFKEIGNCLLPSSFLNDRPFAMAARSTSQELPLRKLLHYRDMRMKLYELCSDIGDFFSLPILFCLTCCFVAVFCSLYSIFEAIHFGDIDLSVMSMSYALEMIFMIPYPVVSLALNVTRIGKEAQLTKRIVDRLLEVAIRKKIVLKLELFSRQLLHENVSFTAYGFFSLDSSLLLSMLGGTATYFVALVQLSPNSACNCREISTVTSLTTTEFT